jgi:hypothetical protein
MDYLVFNELSHYFKNKHEASKGIKIFIQTFAAASRLGFNQLRVHKNIGKDLYNLELAPGYYVSNWLHSHTPTTHTYAKKDKTVGSMQRVEDDPSSHDLRERFRDIFTSAPLITDDEPIEKDINDRSTFEISIQQGELKTAEGLGAAFLLDTIALSFLSLPFWDTNQIKDLKHYHIKDDGSDVNESVEVRHASRPGHMEFHTEWLDKKKRASLMAAGDLWERREEFFPHLVLCGCIEQQLAQNIGIGSKYFNQIIDRLKSLDAYAKDWTTGKFSDKSLKRYGLNVSGESEQTMRKYGRDRRFRLPGKGKATFEKHIKTGDLRFHFYPDEESHLIYVGYIGPHLRTVTG